jgi:hypothetical protein
MRAWRSGSATAAGCGAGGERAPAVAAHRADQVGGLAAEDRRHGDAAGNREVGARPEPAFAEAHARTGRDDERRIGRNGASVERHHELGAGDGDQALVLELELRAKQRDLERRRLADVADERVGEPVRHRIHRPGHGHAARLKSPAPPILNRREHARLDHVDGCRQPAAGLIDRNRLHYSHASYSRRSIG